MPPTRIVEEEASSVAIPALYDTWREDLLGRVQGRVESAPCAPLFVWSLPASVLVPVHLFLAEPRDRRQAVAYVDVMPARVSHAASASRHCREATARVRTVAVTTVP